MASKVAIGCLAIDTTGVAKRSECNRKSTHSTVHMYMTIRA